MSTCAEAEAKSTAATTTTESGEQTAGDLTRLLNQWSQDQWNQQQGTAGDAVGSLIYQELHWLAGRYLRNERSDHTLQPTALVHEAWMRLADMNMPQFNNRKHFYAVAAKLMRQVLVDHARQRLAGKRGGGVAPVQLNEQLVYSDDRAQDYLLLHQALERLAEADARKAQAIELRFFSGMTTGEIAEHLGISVSTVLREQRFAEAWLSRYMRSGVASGDRDAR